MRVRFKTNRFKCGWFSFLQPLLWITSSHFRTISWSKKVPNCKFKVRIDQVFYKWGPIRYSLKSKWIDLFSDRSNCLNLMLNSSVNVHEKTWKSCQLSSCHDFNHVSVDSSSWLKALSLRWTWVQLTLRPVGATVGTSDWSSSPDWHMSVCFLVCRSALAERFKSIPWRSSEMCKVYPLLDGSLCVYAGVCCYLRARWACLHTCSHTVLCWDAERVRRDFCFLSVSLSRKPRGREERRTGTLHQ